MKGIRFVGELEMPRASIIIDAIWGGPYIGGDGQIVGYDGMLLTCGSLAVPAVPPPEGDGFEAAIEIHRTYAGVNALRLERPTGNEPRQYPLCPHVTCPCIQGAPGFRPEMHP